MSVLDEKQETTGGDDGYATVDEGLLNTTPNALDLSDKDKKDIQEFDTMLHELSAVVDSKLKNMWRLTFQNALTDRRNSYIAYIDLYLKVHGNEDMHGLHGLTLTKYLERMEKSNAQILKITELIAKELEKTPKEEKSSSQSLFDQIGKRKEKKVIAG